MDLLLTGSFGLANTTFTDTATQTPRFRTSTKGMQMGSKIHTIVYGIPPGSAAAAKYAVMDSAADGPGGGEPDDAQDGDDGALEMVGAVDLACYVTDRDHAVVVNSRVLTPRRLRGFSCSETFTAADGREYKWKIESQLSGECRLVDVQTKQTIAQCGGRSRLMRRAGKLHVEAEGLPVLNEIIATMVYLIRRWDNGW
ncbi:hypothetical protein HDZ31DRAFT_43800 [Schizophyllum fasciatum]